MMASRIPTSEEDLATSVIFSRKALYASRNRSKMAAALDEPPDISFPGLFGSIMERRSVLL